MQLQERTLPFVPDEVYDGDTPANLGVLNTTRRPCRGKCRQESDHKGRRQRCNIRCLYQSVLELRTVNDKLQRANRRRRTRTAAGYPKFASIWKMGSGSVGLYKLNRLGPKLRSIAYWVAFRQSKAALRVAYSRSTDGRTQSHCLTAPTRQRARPSPNPHHRLVRCRHLGG